MVNKNACFHGHGIRKVSLEPLGMYGEILAWLDSFNFFIEFEGDGRGRMNLKINFDSTVSTVKGEVRSDQSSSMVINN